MTGTVLKVAMAIGGGLGVLFASTAFAAEAPELEVMAHASTAPSITQSAGNFAPTPIVAADQRVTNLQKSATFIAVSGIDSNRRRRSAR